jgi:hypothetical protein
MLAALIWFAAVGAAWAWWWTDRAVDDERTARWRAAVDALARTPPAPSSAAPDPERLMADVRALAFPRHTPADRARARAWIAGRLRDLGWTPVELPFATGVNLQAERPGTAGTLLLSAHYDTVPGSPGADDDASGIAALLEVARHFAGHEGPRGLRLVFFDREESGLEGSRAYAARDDLVDGLVGAVSLEMLGVACRAPGCQRFPPGLPIAPPSDRGDFVAVVGSAEHLSLLAAFAGAAAPGRPPVVALPVPDRGRALPDTRRSDHAPFWDRGLGAVMVTDTADLRYAHYHTQFDVPSVLDPAFLAGATAIVVDATAAIIRPPGSSGAAPSSAPGSSR